MSTDISLDRKDAAMAHSFFVDFHGAFYPSTSRGLERKTNLKIAVRSRNHFRVSSVCNGGLPF
jgi:hypothetical protein